MPNNNIIKEGDLNLAGLSIPCYVLEDGTRVLSGRAMQEAMSIRDKPKKGEKRAGYILPTFFSSKSLKPFVDRKLEVANLEPIICKRGNQTVHGYEATVLADLCDAVLEARKSGEKLTERQEIVADKCEILIRSFAKVGIIALVDEATGYQYDREKLELQSILEAFISKEILEWQRTFELSFYKEIFRLWKIPFTAENIKRKPLFIGKLTNELVYKNMPKGYFVLDKLKHSTPRTEGGNYKYRLHQSLTKEAGRTALIKVINSVEALASVSKDKGQFLKLMKDKYNPEMQLKLFPEIDELAAKEDKKPAVQKSMFDKNIEGLLSVPPMPKEKK